MRKTKGYSKGGAKMMKAMKGKMMTKGMRKGGVKTAMGGKMMSKGYAKGGTKMMKARVGRAITGDRRPNKVITKKKLGPVGRAITGDKGKMQMSLAQAKKVLKENNMKAIPVSRLTKNFNKFKK